MDPLNRFALVTSSALVLFAATPAWAAPPPAAPVGEDAASTDDAVAKARAHFLRAQQLYDEGHPDAAVLELRRAYAAKPHYRLLHNLGELAFTTHDYVASLQAFEGFLREGGDDIEPAKRAEAESRLVTLRLLVGHLRVHTDIPGATVAIDDEPSGTTPLESSSIVNAGRHRIVVTKDGFLPASLVVNVAGGEQTDADLKLVPLVASAPRPRDAAEAPTSQWTTLSWLGLGASGALAFGAVVTGVASAEANDGLSRITYVGASPSQEFRDQEAAVKRDRIVAFALGGAAATTLATTLYFTLSRKPSEKNTDRSSLRVGLGGPGLIFQGNFQ